MGSSSNIDRLARCWGLLPTFTDIEGRRRRSKRASLLALLRQVGAPVDGAGDVDDALRLRQREERERLAPPVLVLWEGGRHRIALRASPAERRGEFALTLRLERGEVVRSAGRVSARGVIELPGEWQAGYHRLEIESRERSQTVHVIAAPRRCHDDDSRSWGLFLPLHALRREGSARVADYGDLGRLLDWCSARGASFLGTLPLLPIDLSRPVDPSPYRPLSRQLWSELHIDASALPGTRGSRAPSTASTLLDHAAEWERLEPQLERAARRHFAAPERERRELSRFLRERPHVREYARFRAAWRAQGRPWTAWPGRMRAGKLRAADVDRGTEQTFLHAQWLAARQIEGLRSRDDGASLYLDMPLGSHPHGFDCYRHQDLFAHGVSVGAPPDAFNPHGQGWAFPPILPERSRETGHRYFAECVRHAMTAAGMLRIDHVMSLHRCFWIPRGAGAADGVYVRYPSEELYAVICLESTRARCRVVGEDLGTVPREVRPALRRHAMMRISVVQFGRARKRGKPLTSMKLPGVASIQTHDMPPLADWWRGGDIDRRLKLGLLTETAARRQRLARRKTRAAWLRDLGLKDARRILPALLGVMCESEARCVLVDLEDLWGEREPQNIPGTTDAWPNWRRRARLPFEAFSRDRRVLTALRRLSARDRREAR